ncbi:MAG: tail fiber protein, partial [Verrucomicrobiota bacterium]
PQNPGWRCGMWLSLLLAGLILPASAQNQAPIFFGSGTAVTSSAGGTNRVAVAQPTLAMKWFICTQGIFPSRDGNPLGGIPDYPMIGEIRCLAFDANTNILGWLPCDGRVLSVYYSTALFSLLGNMYGGDGYQTFALPDLRGRVPVGMDSGGGYPIGAKGGSDAVALNVANLPGHTHTAGGQTTSATGGNVPLDTRQPFLALNICLQSSGVFDSIGWVRIFGFYFTPNGCYPCTGGTVARAANSALFYQIGAAFGGNGTSTFGIPDLRGRSLLGAGQGTGLTSRSVGDAPGAAAHTLSESEMPAHTHALPIGTTGSTGGGVAFDNMKPGLALNAAVAVFGLYLGIADDPAFGEVRFYAGSLPYSGFYPANGSPLPVSGNPALFNMLGTNYGGDGTSLFNLPDLRGRFAASADSRPLGTSWGTETISLTADQMPLHTHTYVPASDIATNFTVSIAEGQTNVTTLFASDPDGPLQTVSLGISGGADAGKFSLDANTGALTFQAPPNFEVPGDADHNNVYEVTVTATDNGTPPMSTTLSVSVVVTNVFETPNAGISFNTNAILGVPLTVQIIGSPYLPIGALDDPLTLTSVIGDAGSVVSTDGTNVTYLPIWGETGYFVYTVVNSDGGSNGQIVFVQLQPNPGYNTLAVSLADDGSNVVSFHGAPGVHYAVEATPTLTPPAWTALTTNTALPSGWLWFTNATSEAQQFYRTRYVP